MLGVNLHWIGSNQKRYQQSTNADKKSIETVFSIVGSGAKNGNQKHCFYDFLSIFLDSIGVFDCRLPSVNLSRH